MVIKWRFRLIMIYRKKDFNYKLILEENIPYLSNVVDRGNINE